MVSLYGLEGLGGVRDMQVNPQALSPKLQNRRP